MAKRAAPEVNAGEDQADPPVIKQKNIFTVLLNGKDDLLVEEETMDLKDLRQAAIDFLDNNGDKSCTYCNGKKDSESSDNPDKAIISLKNERETSYKAYIAVQNELVAAYNVLRDKRAESLYGISFKEMQANHKDVNWPGNKEKLKKEIEQIKLEYPQKLSEVQNK